MAPKRVLVVEDEMMLALSLEDILGEIGCETVGPAMQLDQALELARSETIDFAILDINLGAKTRSDAVARLLTERNVPFLFMSGYGDAGASAEFPDAQILAKPAAPEVVQDAVRRRLNL